MKRIATIVAALVAGGTAMPAAAATQLLDFAQGNYCRGGQLCTNNGTIDQSYGDTAEVDMTYLSFRSPPGPGFYYERGFGDLVGVLFAGNGDPNARGLVVFNAQEGFEVSLSSFDIACYNGNADCRSATYRVSSDNVDVLGGTVGTGYPGHATVTPATGFYRQLVLDFGAGENVGVDNIRFETRAVTATPDTPAVPEPAAWMLMIGGFGAVGATLRRKGAARVAHA